MAELEGLTPHLLHFNADALTETGRNVVLEALDQARLQGEHVSVLLHSIAKGALKPLALDADLPPQPLGAKERSRVDAPDRPPATALQSRDILLTVEAMGTSLLDWVTDLRQRQLFAADARVIAFTSEGSRRVWPSYAAVSAAKATLEALVRAIAFELGPFGIRANCISAGITDTRALRLVPGSEELKRHAVARNPLGRLTTPEDVANVVSLLTKPEAAWINGTIIVVDGGEHLC
jgi:enoyl-[acyl-carrier protein] reductase I